MAKNHYVSQLIIKRFAPAVTTFDTVERKIIENRKAHKIFYNIDIYDDEIEKKLAFDLERPFAELLDKKILHAETITLTRQELFLVKRFLLLDSVRTYPSNGFAKVLHNFNSNVDRYIKMHGDINQEELLCLPSIFDLHLSDREIQMRAMKVYIESNDIMEILHHPLVTRELYCWAKVNSDSYLAFWDSHETQEFILTSTGMVSEYEPSHTIFEGLDLSKQAYLCDKIAKEKDKYNLFNYNILLSFNQIMYENFNVFNLSSTRCMVLIHPFFRLYDKVPRRINGIDVCVEMPDVWPSCFETKEIIATPRVKYIKPCLEFNPLDEFEYTHCKLSAWDTIYLNSIILRQTHQLLGFNDITKIIDSLVFMNMVNSFSDKELLDELRGIDALERWIDNVIKDKYFYVFQHYSGLNPKCLYNPLELMDKFYQRSWNDIVANKHVLKYLLERESLVRSMDNFRFLGTPDQRIANLESMLDAIN